jgi:hypothetical protein
MAIGDVGAPLWPVAGIDRTANTPEPRVDMRLGLSSTSRSSSRKIGWEGAACVGCVSRSSIERPYGEWRRWCAAVAGGRNRPDREHTRTTLEYEHEHEHEHSTRRVCEPVIDRTTLWRMETLVRRCGRWRESTGPRADQNHASICDWVFRARAGGPIRGGDRSRRPVLAPPFRQHHQMFCGAHHLVDANKLLDAMDHVLAAGEIGGRQP